MEKYIFCLCVGLTLGFQRFQSYGCGKAKLWKRASPFRSPCVKSQITVTEKPRNSLPVVCTVTWHRHVGCVVHRAPFLQLHLSIDRVGLVVNVSITNRTLKHSTTQIGCSEKKKNRRVLRNRICIVPSVMSHPKMPEIVGSWISHLWIVSAFFKRVFEASVLMTRAH